MCVCAIFTICNISLFIQVSSLKVFKSIPMHNVHFLKKKGKARDRDRRERERERFV